MGRVRFKGLDEYMLKITKLGTRTEEICGKAIYHGAEIIADAVKENIRDLPVDESYGTHGNKTHGLKQIQKTGLEKSFGITKLRNDADYYNVKLGFDGYNGLTTKGHPHGQPNQMIARAIESGTSFSDKIPFVRPAVTWGKPFAEKRMAKVLDEEIEKIMEK